MDEPVTHVGDVVVHYRATERRLRPGDRLTFGRDPGPGRPGPSTAPHLGLSTSPALHAMAGRLSVDATGCTLDNTGRWLRLRVLHLDGVERSDLDPGRGLRIPWARSRVEVAVGAEPLWFGLEVPQRAGAPGGVPDAGGDTQRASGWTDRPGTSARWSRSASLGCATPAATRWPAPGRSPGG